MTSRKLRILVVDDTILYRKVLSDILSKIPDVEVVGTANNGKIALTRIEQLKPDLVTLDFEMPEMDGLTTLRELQRLKLDVVVIMVSAHTSEGAAVTIKALEGGAFDFIAKPDGSSPERNKESLIRQLRPLILSVSTRKLLRSTLGGAMVQSAPRQIASSQPSIEQRAAKTLRSLTAVEAPRIVPGAFPGRVAVVAIGVSTGGPNALAEVIPRLPRNLRVPVVIVQHMPPVFTKALADSLNQKSVLNVLEARGDELLQPGNVYLAPGGKQMKVVKKAAGEYLQLADDPPENHCRPAADYLFRSIASVYGNRSLGVIMTGMGADGVKGLRLMKQQGAQVIAQDEATCVVFGMPMEAIRAGVTDKIVSLDQIATQIIARVNG